MKKIALFFAAALMTGAVAAQDAPVLTDALKAKNAGNEAYNNKDYVTAIAEYEKYIKSGEEGVADDIYTQNLYEMSFYYAGNLFLQEKNYEKAYEYFEKFQNLGRSDTPTDGRFLYNFANTARQLKKNDVAKDLYSKCLAIDYNQDACNYAIAMMSRTDKQVDTMLVYVNRLIEAGPEGKYYPTALLLLQTEQLKDAVEPFNQASTWSQKAGAAGSDVNAYVANMSKAVDLYKQAIPLFEKVLAIPGVDDKTKANLDKATANIKVCKESIDRFESYRKTIKR